MTGKPASGTTDLAVIGGGLHGCSLALQAALKGLSVVVLEKDSIARHASGVNAGGVRRLGRHPAEIPLSLASMRMWHEIEELVHDDCGFQVSGQVKVAETEGEMGNLRLRAEQLRSQGYEHEVLLDGEELYRLLPALKRGCPGGLACLDDGFAEPYRTTQAFRRRAEALGVRFLEKTRVLSLEARCSGCRLSTSSGELEAGVVANCAGAWAARICEQLGEPVPLEPIAPMMTVTQRLPFFVKPVVGTTGRLLSFKQMPNGTVLIGGGHRGRAEPQHNGTALDFRRLIRNVQIAADLFPSVRGARIIRCWAGIEARMPDDIPVISRSSTASNVLHAFGFSAHGFQLGPVVGRLMSELIVSGESSLSLKPFSITRFQRDRPAATS
ncbi:NAD(P)/FAD-dependent oxidoreductase [Fodinicurvata fenggangensis]|uniref:NAD(P)/FAD-dependent oxidoreductase n=1 Tax=Fodinicurvata fenggangensis TaxID=1121830 RepID=UPI00047C5286|nr:FAD-dependent oxidoreductase [Fodinicurvata fenggangensis]